ncbi:MAG: ral secretory pathway protein [Proteobacteria bacterium]|nr:ral secretory pathway protein [Pseudomonadota bacterium]
MEHAQARSVRAIPYLFAKTQGVFVTRLDDLTGELCAREGVSPLAISEVRRALGRPVTVAIEAASTFDQRLAEAYSQQSQSSANLAEDWEQGMDLNRLVEDLRHIEDLLESEDDAPIIRMINAVLMEALREKASDIHFEPFESRSVIRFRLDGSLRDVIEPHRALHGAIVSRIKIMASLDIAEKRLPQDGRISLRLAGRHVDVRVSTLPTGFGERVVLRLLDKESGKLEMSRLGMSSLTLEAVDGAIRQPHGIFLVTGPTGSGKTTTLYAALTRLNTGSSNIITVEDPIEYELDGVGQTQVNAKIDLDFARALRSILRQDPDIVMIGEIRDLETAQIAVQASLTGHLVLATLHTNDAPSAITRLVDMGVEPYLLSSSLIGVLAQRLVRCLCPHCRRAVDASPRECQEVGIPFGSSQLHHAQGCNACRNTGYRGRTGIYEYMAMDQELRVMIHQSAPEHEIRAHAVAHGMTPLRQDGMRWVAEGTTALEEVLRVTREN